MKSRWITIVGVLGIIFSCLGVLGATQGLVTPAVMEFQKEMFTKMQTMPQSVQSQAAVSSDQKMGVSAAPGTLPPKEFMELFEKMWNVPQWFKRWSLFSGFAALGIWGVCLFSSIWLLQLKKDAPRLLCGVLIVNLVFLVTDSIASGLAGSFLGLSKIAGNAFWCVVSVVLLIVIVTADKKDLTER
ncbi:MAG: hypothetical protein WC547_07120 [Candidatus Omnitrophota bacterium]